MVFEKIVVFEDIGYTSNIFKWICYDAYKLEGFKICIDLIDEIVKEIINVKFPPIPTRRFSKEKSIIHGQSFTILTTITEEESGIFPATPGVSRRRATR